MDERIRVFTGPQRMEKAISTLLGLLEGMCADGTATSPECEMLAQWVDECNDFSSRHPFNEIVPRLKIFLADGIVDSEELADLIWLCKRMIRPEHFDQASLNMQQLHGIMAAIACDQVISADELNHLSNWINDHQHLKGRWPFDEVESLILGVLKDGFIDSSEHTILLTFFEDFGRHGDRGSLTIQLNEPEVPLMQGLCCVCPEVQFEGRTFCFTGESNRATRQQLAELVSTRGGQCIERVTRDLDYLVIGAAGNPCWAYACYGRKVEQAIDYRKKYDKPILVHELDFWDVLA